MNGRASAAAARLRGVSAVVLAGRPEAAMDDAERQLLLAALQACNGHKGHAADKLGISRHALKRRLQRLGID